MRLRELALFMEAISTGVLVFGFLYLLRSILPERNERLLFVCLFPIKLQLTTPENTLTYHNALCLSPQNFA